MWRIPLVRAGRRRAILGTTEGLTSGVSGLADSAISLTAAMMSATVRCPILNSSAILRPLMPSLCFSRIAASRFSFSCTERAGGYLGVVHFRDSRFCTGWLQGVLGVGIFPDSGFLPRRLQVVLGSAARDTVIWRIPLFYSTASGRPRDYAGFASRGIFGVSQG